MTYREYQSPNGPRLGHYSKEADKRQPNSPTRLVSSPSSVEVEGPSRTEHDLQAPNIRYFTMAHLELLHHAETLMAEEPSTRAIEDGLTSMMLRMVVSKALSSECLMNQFLAISALRMSVVYPKKKAFYLQQATQLRKRAVLLFETSDVSPSDDELVCRFLFSALRGLHTLFDTLRLCGDLHSCLDMFVDFLDQQQEVRRMASQVWNTGGEKALQPIMDAIGVAEKAPCAPCRGKECDRLLGMVQGADLSPSSIDACRHAAEKLQWVFDMQHQMSVNEGGAAVQIVLAWPTAISAHFISVMKRRTPEGLVILAYWAVLLHRYSRCWLFGDTVAILIRSITRYLGSYWEKELAWVVQEVSKTAEEASVDHTKTGSASK